MLYTYYLPVFNTIITTATFTDDTGILVDDDDHETVAKENLEETINEDQEMTY